MYPMEYEDDPGNIMTCVDRPSREWELDDDDICIHSEAHLSIIELDSITSHVLLIPFYPYIKFKLGVLGQSLWWANCFVTD
jgi:hypothetical protein